MADLPPYPASNDDTGDDTGVGPGRESTRRRPRWVMVFGIILVKLGVIALILVLPFELAISLGAAHGVALLVLLVATALAVYKPRSRTRGEESVLKVGRWPGTGARRTGRHERPDRTRLGTLAASSETAFAGLRSLNAWVGRP